MPAKLALNAPCPCCSGEPYGICCAPFLNAAALPETAEALMRSRYTAFTQAKMTYLIDTQALPVSERFDRVDAKRWAKACEWQGLEVLTYETLPESRARVHFKAYYQLDGRDEVLEENSLFARLDGRWYYIDKL